LGSRGDDRKRLEEAIVALRDALKERTRERAPLDWAVTKNNIGMALFELGEREDGTARIEEAIAAFREALEECTADSAPHYHELCSRNLTAAEELLSARRRGEE
jgi:tetratricopeptide (TPR) repeat protein